MSSAAQRLIASIDAEPVSSAGPFERFRGYGILGVSFDSGHVLAMRHFSASSVGPGYASVWHRRPDGGWWFYADAPPAQSCARYFGRALECVVHTEVRVEWCSPTMLRVAVPLVRLDWELILGEHLLSRAVSGVLHRMPAAAWAHAPVVAALGWGARAILRSGPIRLAGTAPNGQRFVVAPRGIVPVRESRASIAGRTLGLPSAVMPQVRLGDFRLPQRGWLAAGHASFERFDPVRHADALTRHGRPRATEPHALHPTLFGVPRCRA